MPLNNFGFVYHDCKTAPFISRSAQPDQLGFDDLSDLGVDCIFKLSNSSEFDAKKEQDLFKYGAVYEHALPELFRAGCGDQVIQICQMIHNQFDLCKAVHIHCSHGRDRTGLIAGAYQLMYMGRSIKEIDADRPAYGCNALIELVDSPDRHILTDIYLMKCAGKL
jgi:protein tyrosine/serine phosphatase